MTSKQKCGALVLALVSGVAFGQGVRLAAVAGSGDRAQAAVAPDQPVRNGSFEEVAGNVPAGWRTAQFQRGAQFGVETAGRTGSRSVRITSADGADAAWTTVAVVRPYAKYRLTGWIRTEGVEQVGSAKGALLNIHGMQPLQTPAIAGTRDWTRVELTFDTEGNDALQINCLLGGWGKVTGTAWYDDIALELLSARELAPAAAIDAARRRAPVSPYVYGQFIEHLGRCIYGGIWAEMLEDRKFFHADGDKESPWSV
ncbi:MAG: hypothetical protein EHM24_07590, partial [Acidobacteria bacterium]